jgi:quercetin dioxygenase-like cupin family protein
MSRLNRIVLIAGSGAAAAALCFGSSALAKGGASEPQPVLLLEQSFEPRTVEKVEIGDFHFTHGLLAPVHTHEAPVFGYVSRGRIKYQVAGQGEQLLNKGDAFYEPAGPDILHFDDAGSEAAVFTDFNFEKPGEPFIKFAEPLSVKIDRRTLPTVELGGEVVDKIQVYAYDVGRDQHIALAAGDHSTLWYVDSGQATLELPGARARHVQQGRTFAVPKGQAGKITVGKSRAAKLICFRLLSSR